MGTIFSEINDFDDELDQIDIRINEANQLINDLNQEKENLENKKSISEMFDNISAKLKRKLNSNFQQIDDKANFFIHQTIYVSKMEKLKKFAK